MNVSRQVIVDEFLQSCDDECPSCNTVESECWIKTTGGQCICTNCVFGTFQVKYNGYLDAIMNARRKSLEKSVDKGEPSELIGQCHRNSAQLANTLHSKLNIPKEHLFICVGTFRDYNTENEIRHYWVVIETDAQEIHIDSVVPVDNGGIWVDEKPPKQYSIERKISLRRCPSLPNEVRKWVNI